MSHHLPSIAHRTLAAFTLASSGFVSFASAAIITVCPDGSCNFTTPVAAVTAAVSGDTIQISAGTYMLDSTISLLNKQLVIRGAVDAAGHPATVLNAGGTGRIFSFSVIGNTTSIENLVITNGRADHGGAMFFDGANPVFRNCAIQNNRATFHGGAIYLNDSSPTFIYCELTDNRTITQGAGGAIFVSAGTPTINSCSLTGNTSSDGGAIFLSSSGRVNLQSTRVCGNSASIDPQIGMNTGGIVNDLGGACVANDCAACPPPPDCPADFDGNRVVNGLDFSILLSNWGTCSGCASDINRDGLVNGLDLTMMFSGWGDCQSAAQPGLVGWNRDGQTWLVWNDNLTFSGLESVSVYRSSAPITTLAQLQAAERIGRLYPQDWKAARLTTSHPSATWTIPSANGAPLTLLSSEGLFVYTPHEAAPEYFAVVKTENLLTGPFSSTGPIVQTLDPVVPHLQKSGFDAGHPYEIRALWVDGRTDHDSGRADFPVMESASCNGTAHLYSIFEPTIGLPAAPMPCVVFLHGGGGSYWNFRPSMSDTQQMVQHVENGLYITLDSHMYLRVGASVVSNSTGWFGHCDNYDRFEDITVQPPSGTLVVNYAQRRINWILDWLQTTRGVDPHRTSMAGLSGGGRGTYLFARVYPERLSTSLTYVMPTNVMNDDGPAFSGTFAQNLATTLPGAIGFYDLYTPTTLYATVDLPFMHFIDGTTDTQALWTGKPPTYDALNAWRMGAAIWWDGRGHTASSPTGWAGAHFNGSPRFAAQTLTGYRNDQSFPAIHDVDHNVAVSQQQPNPGDPVVPANGSPWGSWGGWFDWNRNSIVDTVDAWSCELWLETTAAFSADNAPLSTARASVTLRRLQFFALAPHEPAQVKLALAQAPFTVVFSGTVSADASGVLTIPNLLFGSAHLRLSVER